EHHDDGNGCQNRINDIYLRLSQKFRSIAAEQASYQDRATHIGDQPHMQVTTALIGPYTRDCGKEHLYGTYTCHLVGSEGRDPKDGRDIQQHRIFDDRTTDPHHPGDEGTDEPDQKYDNYKGDVHYCIAA